MKFLAKSILVIALTLGVFSPSVALAQPEFTGDIVPECAERSGVDNVCGYCDLMLLAERVVEFLIFLGVVIAILMIVYAGFLYVTAFSNSAQVTKAHGLIRNAIFGLVIVLASWLIIDAIVTGLGVKESIGDPWVLPGCEGYVEVQP